MKAKLAASDKRTGNARTFWRNVNKSSGDEGPWIWTGETNTNHNTVDCDKYVYGQFDLAGCKSKMAHRISLFLTYGREVPSTHDVFPMVGADHLNVNPMHLGVREKVSRLISSATEYFSHNVLDACVCIC